MSTPVHIIDGRGTKGKSCITSIGQLVTGPIKYDETKFIELAEDDTAYNFYLPRAGEQFVITGFIATADQQVASNADANVVIYEATSPTSTTEAKNLIQFAITQKTNITATPLNILVNSGVYLNAKTDDDDIHMTIMGYYIPILTQGG